MIFDLDRPVTLTLAATLIASLKRSDANWLVFLSADQSRNLLHECYGVDGKP